VDFVHRPDTVREIAAYLRSRDVDRVVADLRAAVERGRYVYSFAGWGSGDQDIIECGLFAEVYRNVCGLYSDAALANHVVHVARGS
jgi:hypothetical protein